MGHFDGLNHPIFHAFDILSMICSHVEGKNLPSFQLVSRDFFGCASPRVWEHLPNVQPLLGLFSEIWDNRDTENTNSFEQPASRSLSRFEFYVPFVKRMDLELPYEDKRSWPMLLVLVQHRPLLPNLRKLTFTEPRSLGHPSDIPTCFMAFLCPSLSEICLPRHTQLWLEPPLASLLIKAVTRVAPTLEVLRIFVKHSARTYYPKPVLFGDITLFRHLRTLQCTNAMIDSIVLRLMSTLPLLDSLAIEVPSIHDDEDRENNLDIDNLVLPIDSFPSLRHISIWFLPCSVISLLWNKPPLVQRLLSINIRFPVESEPEAIDNAIGHICSGSLKTQELCLDFDEVDDHRFTSVTTNHLQRLSLRRFRVYDGYFSGPACDFEYLLPTLVRLEYFDMWNAWIDFEELTLVAKQLPNLQYLSISLILEGWPAADFDLCSIKASPSTLCLTSRFLFGEDSGVDEFSDDDSFISQLDVIARNLHALWPRGVHCRAEDAYTDERVDSDYDYLRLLNSKIMEMSEPAGIQPLSYEECLASWLYHAS